jgi:hypothetical protein
MRHADHATPLYPQNLAPTLPTSGGRSVGVVRSRTKIIELLLMFCFTRINWILYNAATVIRWRILTFMQKMESAINYVEFEVFTAVTTKECRLLGS